MGPLYPNPPHVNVHDGAKADPTPIFWADEAWQNSLEPVLRRLQEELHRTVRGGPVFAIVLQAWKSGAALGSNTEIAAQLSWDKGEVAEGFRLVRDRLRAWRDPVFELRVKEYSRELVVTARGVSKTGGDLLLSVGGNRPEVAGQAMTGAAPVVKARGMRLVCEQAGTATEQAQSLDPSAYAAYLILPVDETDDFGAMARLGALGRRVVLLDIATRNGALPCVSFDYTGAGLYCTQQLLELGCSDVLLLTRENDSRTYSINEGHRQAVRRAGAPSHRMATVDGDVVETLCWLQERGLLTRDPGRKLGLLCADAELGQAILRYLDAVPDGSWEIAVAVVGGNRWAARHWVELIWVELDYAALAAAGAKFLAATEGATVPKVLPRYEQWTPRKPAGSTADSVQAAWRRVVA